MRKSGAKAFWLSFFLTLAILLPLLGGLIFYSGWKWGQARQAEKSQSGVPLGGPGAETDLTVLVTVAAEQPGFVLVRLDAQNGVLHLCPVPAESVLLAPGGTMLLADSYSSAGPARAAALLAATLNIRIDKYLAVTPDTLGKLWGQLEPPRVNLTGLLDQEALAALGLEADPVLSLPPAEANAFITGLGLPPARAARVRAAVWDAALRQQLDNLADTIPAGLRKQSGSLLTDLTAADFYTLENTFRWLAKKQAEVQAEPVAGRYDQQAQRYEFGEDSIAFAKLRFVPATGETAEKPLYATPAPVSDPLGEGQQTASPSPQPTAAAGGGSAAPESQGSPQPTADARQTGGVPVPSAPGAGGMGQPSPAASPTPVGGTPEEHPAAPPPPPPLPPRGPAPAGSLE